MANQLVQYGAVAAGAAAIPAIAKGMTAGTTAFQNSLFDADWSAAMGGQASASAGAYGTAAADAASAGGKAFASSFTDTITSTSFLSTVGLGLAGVILGSGSKRPSLSLPNLAATAAVGISVANLLAKGKAAAGATSLSKGASIDPVNFTVAPPEDVGAVTAKSRTSSSTTLYQYPLNANHKYWMRFKIKKYHRNTLSQRDSESSGNYHTWIRLPLPSAIMDAIKLTYNELGLGMFGGEAAKEVGNIIESYEGVKRSGGSNRDAVSAMTSQAKESFTRVINTEGIGYSVARRALQGSALGQAADMLSGNAPNPHMSVTFQGVNLKKYSFTWRFSPSSWEESRQIQNIVKEFQRASLPGYESETNHFMFTFPDVVQIEMSPHNLMMFQPCAIDSVAVNYAPNGVPSFFKNANESDQSPVGVASDALERYPTEIEFSIVLRELEVHTNDLPFYNNFSDVYTPSYTPPAPASPVVVPNLNVAPRDIA